MSAAGVVIRDTEPWTRAVHALLRHLKDVGYAAGPQLAGPGLDEYGRQTRSFRAVR